MPMRGLLLFSLVIFICQLTTAQFDDDLVFKERFNLEVIQIEEFFQRFNYSDNTRLIKYLHNNYPDLKVNRRAFVKSLFESTYYNNNVLLINSFVDYICDKNNPIYVDFYDKEWFAEVQIVIEAQGRVEDAKLILKSQLAADSSSKWVIEGVSSELFNIPRTGDSMGILSPVSHGTDFIALYNIIKNGKNVINYFSDDFNIDQLTFLAVLMYYNKISIKDIKSIKYHFLQIPDWLFTVSYINRKELNTGWLITELKLLSHREKEVYKNEILNIKESD